MVESGINKHVDCLSFLFQRVVLFCSSLIHLSNLIIDIPPLFSPFQSTFFSLFSVFFFLLSSTIHRFSSPSSLSTSYHPHSSWLCVCKSSSRCAIFAWISFHLYFFNPPPALMPSFFVFLPVRFNVSLASVTSFISNSTISNHPLPPLHFSHSPLSSLVTPRIASSIRLAFFRSHLHISPSISIWTKPVFMMDIAWQSINMANRLYFWWGFIHLSACKCVLCIVCAVWIWLVWMVMVSRFDIRDGIPLRHLCETYWIANIMCVHMFHRLKMRNTVQSFSPKL